MKNLKSMIEILIFLAFAVAVGAFFYWKTQNIKTDTYQLKTYFNFVSGIKENSIVALSGYEVGRVDKVEFVYDPATRIEVVMSISKKAKVRTDSLAYIGSAGFIGDAFVGLTTGSPEAGFAEPGSEIKSEDPIEMRELMKKADGIAKKLDDTLVDVKKLAANLSNVVEENKAKISNIVSNIDITIADNKTRVDNIMKNLEQTSSNFNEFSGDIKRNPWKLLMKGKEQ
jgi:phospholipid/cholesterol/gamma-HCH transport system substrate-binding protein